MNINEKEKKGYWSMAEKIIVWLEIHDKEIQKVEDSVLPAGFKILRPQRSDDKEEHLALMRQADYLIAGGIPVTKEYIEAADKLKMIQKWGIGCDKIDCAAARDRNIPVYITAGANAVPVAELAVGLMFAVNRKIPAVDASMRRGEWIKSKMRPQCQMIHGKTIGLLGIGNIAKEVAKMLRGFEKTQIIYYDIHPLSKDAEKEYGVHYVDFETLLSESDILSIHIPLLDATRHMIGEKELKRMKSSAILINTARGGVVDEAALIAALKDGTIRGAGLDSFEEEPVSPDNGLLQLENVVLTCHCGGGVADNVIPVTEHAYRNIRSFEEGKAPSKRDRFC